MNVNKLKWLNWPLNYDDGQMCKLFRNLRDCELESYDSCPTQVVDFINGEWTAILNTTNCSLTNPVKEINGTTEFYDGFINNDYNWNKDGDQNDQWNPMRRRSVDSQDESGDTQDESISSVSDFDWNKYLKPFFV